MKLSAAQAREITERVFTADEIAPLARSAPNSPERELLMAMIEQAREDVVNMRRPQRAAAQQRLVIASYHDAMTWLTSNDAGNPFAFGRVCEFLGLSPSATRKALLDLAPKSL